MKLLLLLFPIALIAQEAKTAPPPPLPAGTSAMMNRGLITMDAKGRSDDIMKAYDFLKKDKPTYRISAHTYSGQTLSNILDITAMPNGTWLLFRMTTQQGPKTQTVPVEDVQELFYSQ